ncbi:MAG: metal-dependent hydrolase [Dactylosporangium sp.]|nr:metal-dependent hydrolase [Dactylosporangium sp.]NNJ60601.1 metal-dependent hydrolase [Dactylosporangium sp.]
MMGPSHALSGAAAWLSGSLALEHLGLFHQTSLQLAVGTAMCAGGALLPDMDVSGKVTANKGGATVAHTFGVVSLFLAECVEKLSLGVYNLTRRSGDPRRHNGHRTLTHTLVFNIALGAGTIALCAVFGKWAVIGVLFFTFAMALRGLFEKWAKRAGWIIVTLAAAAAAFGTYQQLPGGRGYPALGVALGVGGIVHLLGDLLTDRGCPLFWPIPIRRKKLWHCVGVPDALAVKVGGKVEVLGLRTTFTAVAVLAGGLLLAPPLLSGLGLGA